MIKGLKFKFQNIQRNKYTIYALCLFIILSFEIYSYYLFSYVKNKDIYEAPKEKINIQLNTVVNKLKDNDLEIINIQNDEKDGYTFQVAIKGSKEEVCEVLKKFENCIIKEYELNVEANNIAGKVTLSYN